VNERIVFEEEKDPSGNEFNSMLWDFCIVDWKNLLDANRNQIPCTTENKLKLMNRSTKFSKFITGCITKLTEMDTQQEEDLRKNY
jgi:hypothetical protein